MIPKTRKELVDHIVMRIQEVIDEDVESFGIGWDMRAEELANALHYTPQEALTLLNPEFSEVEPTEEDKKWIEYFRTRFSQEVAMAYLIKARRAVKGAIDAM